MSKVYNFTRKDKNRFRKVYRYIRKKPVYEYCSDSEFGMIAGYLDFQNSDGPEVYTFPTTISFTNVPVINNNWTQLDNTKCCQTLTPYSFTKTSFIMKYLMFK